MSYPSPPPHQQDKDKDKDKDPDETENENENEIEKEEMNMSMNSSTVLKNALLAVLAREAPFFTRNMQQMQSMSMMNLPPDPARQRSMLGDLLISSNHDWEEPTLALFDAIWKQEKQDRENNVGELVHLQDIANLHTLQRPSASASASASATMMTTQVGVWKGDITRLTLQAITNAANDEGLGCFAPPHRCIDNVIHRMAGPRLRMKCKQVMQQRNSPLSAGTPPIITSAFYLPSQYVIHVTGPQIPRSTSRGKVVTVTEEEKEKLRLAYFYSLEICAKENITSIAFCGISTGIFGFPKEEATNIAISTVLDWLQDPNNTHEMEAVVFDVFSADEEIMYNEKLDEMMAHYSRNE